MLNMLSGALIFLALSLAPGPRLGALRTVHGRLEIVVAVSADAVLWTFSTLLVITIMHLIEATFLWLAGVVCAFFLAGFLIYTLQQPFDVPAAKAPPGAFFCTPLRRAGLWFDALLVLPVYALVVTSDLHSIITLALGALAAASCVYVLVSRSELAETNLFWRNMRLSKAVSGLITLVLMGLHLTEDYPF
jgi:hypothetical protein